MKCQLLLCGTLCFVRVVLFAADEAVVKAARVNVRGQPTTGSEVVTQLKQGEKITVLEEIVHPKPAKGEPAKWLRIALPSNTPVWVSTLFVQSASVAVPRLNIRSGPGENFSVIGRVPKGTALKELRRNGDWLEVEAPASTYGYIAADLVVRQAGGPAPAVPGGNASQLAGSKSAPKTPSKATDTSGKQMANATPKGSPITPPETKPVPTPVEVAPVVPVPVALPPGEVATKPGPVAPPPAVLTEPAPVPPAVAPPNVPPPAALTENVPPPPVDPYAVTGRYKIEPEPQRGVGAWFKGLFSKKTTGEKAKAAPAAKPPGADDGPPSIRIIAREGVVARSWNIQSPSDWALQDADSGRVINYLWSSSTNIPWATLKGRTVVITGEEALDVRWPNTPVLKIETLKTVDQ